VTQQGAALGWWRSLLYLFVCNVGESVPESERLSDKEFLAADALSASSSTHNLPSIAQSALPGAMARPAAGVSDEERLSWEEERQKLYQQLDDRVSELSYVCPHD